MVSGWKLGSFNNWFLKIQQIIHCSLCKQCIATLQYVAWGPVIQSHAGCKSIHCDRGIKGSVDPNYTKRGKLNTFTRGKWGEYVFGRADLLPGSTGNENNTLKTKPMQMFHIKSLSWKEGISGSCPPLEAFNVKHLFRKCCVCLSSKQHQLQVKTRANNETCRLLTKIW